MRRLAAGRGSRRFAVGVPGQGGFPFQFLAVRGLAGAGIHVSDRALHHRHPGRRSVRARLDEAVRGEHIEGHPLVVHRFNSLDQVDGCQILFIDRSETSQLDQILRTLGHRSILTVSEINGAAQRGVMVEFVTENNRIRLKIDVDAARAAGLPISSKLLRLADIVSPVNGSRNP